MAWDDTFVFKVGKITSAQLNAMIAYIKTLITGTTGLTDNALIRASGTSGLAIQGSAATMDDNGTITIPSGQTYNIGSNPIPLDMLNDVAISSPAQGDLLKSDGTDFTNFAKGSAGHYLKVNSLGTDLEYAAGTAASGDVAHDLIWATKGDIAVATANDAASVLPVGTSPEMILSPDTSTATGLKWNSVRPTLGKSAESLTVTKDNNDIERYFIKDDFSNDTSANYTLSGTSPTISGGHLIIPATGQAYHTITAGTTGRWEGVVQFTEAGAGTAKLLLGDAGTSYVAVTRIVTTDRIWLQLYIGGVSKIANTDTTVTLAEDVSANVSAVYDGTSWQMYWAGVAVGANTAAITVTTPIIGAASVTIGTAWSELTFSPSAAFTETFTLDSETRYMQLSSTDLSTWAASAAGDVVISTGQITLSSADDKGVAAILRSYNFSSGSIDCSFNDAGDGGGGDGSCNLVFGYQDINNYYRLSLEDNAAGGENLKLYKVVAGTKTQLGTTKDVSATYTRGNVTWLRVDWDAERGQIWAYLRDNAAAYPTTPDIADAFSAQFAYGKAGFMATTTTAGAGNLSAKFGSFTCRNKLLVGETNIPATETGFYYMPGGIGSFTQTGTWTYASPTITCSSAGNLIAPFQTTIGVHTFTPTLANGTDYYYFGGYRIKFVASGGNTCAVTLQTTAGVAVGTGTITVTTTAGLFGAPIVITETATSITVTVAGASGSLTPGTTASTNAYPKFEVGTATCTFANYSFTGTRYYNKPMLRGAQLGEYYNGAATVQSTRYTDDFNWDTSAEWVAAKGTYTFDTTNGRIYAASGISGYSAIRTNQQFTDGLYASTIKDVYMVLNWDGTTFATGGVYSGYPTNCYFIVVGTTSIILKKVTGNGDATLVTITTTVVPDTDVIKILKVGSAFSIYKNNDIVGTATDATYTTGYAGFAGWSGSFPATTRYATQIQINALDTTSPNGISASLGGVPHGARYDVQEEVYTTITNAVKSAEKVLVTCAMTTDNANDNVELYLKNTTDSTDVSVTSVVDLALTTDNWTDQHVDMSFNYQDRDDTIKVSARRKTYAVADDADPAVFVQYLYVAPVWEI